MVRIAEFVRIGEFVGFSGFSGFAGSDGFDEPHRLTGPRSIHVRLPKAGAAFRRAFDRVPFAGHRRVSRIAYRVLAYRAALGTSQRIARHNGTHRLARPRLRAARRRSRRRAPTMPARAPSLVTRSLHRRLLDHEPRHARRHRVRR
ncbi:hypothetical protein ACX841_31025, partial [Burkholderia pseudomallei]